MIVVQLLGGMGNQMFQYALGRNLSIKHNTELLLDNSYLGDNNFNHTSRPFALDKFHLKASITTKKFKFLKKRSLLNRLGSIFEGQDRLKLVKEPFFYFDEKIEGAPDNSYLEGYWQSFKYFQGVEDQIRNDFRFTNLQTEKNEIVKKINSSDSVAVHIRRGDYISNPVTSAYHGVCSMDYYNKAIGMIKKKFPNAVFFIFSDEPSWVKENFQLDSEFYIVNNVSDSSSYFDLFLMSSCNHAIIANSSFSWWGAWLNPYPEKMVIAPAKWFNDNSINASDLIPSKWLRV